MKKLLLTASGGPFFGKQKSFVYNATVDMALRHPNWSMGRKITIDSASLVNKGLELIEAMHLFDMPEDKIEIVVHRESVIHSMVQFLDNSVIAQLALPDMRLCIQYALLDGRKAPRQCPELDFSKLSSLTFSVPDNEVFPSINMARKAAKLKGTYPCIFNSANEACVDLFLREKISFGDIFTLIGDALENVYAKTSGVSVEDIINTDIEARNFVYSKIK